MSEPVKTIVILLLAVSASCSFGHWRSSRKAGLAYFFVFLAVVWLTPVALHLFVVFSKR